MKRVLFLFAALLCFAGKARAQAEIPHLAADPATCDNTRGLLYYNTTTSKVMSCTSLNTWTSISGIAANSPVNVKSAPYNAFGDMIYVNNVSISRTASTLTIPVGSTATVGQLVQCVSPSFTTEVVPYPPTNGGQILPATILTVVGQVVTYNTNPVGAGGVLADGQCYFGHDDKIPLKNAFAACQTLSLSPMFGGPSQNQPCNVYLPRGNYMITGTPFDGSLVNQNAAGVSIVGDGNNASVIYPTLGFVNTAPVNCGWVICGFGWGQHYRDFGIEGIISQNNNGGGGGFNINNLDAMSLKCGKCYVENIKIQNFYGFTGQFMLTSAGGAEIHYARVENPNGGAGSMGAFLCNSCSTDIFDPFFSNTFMNLQVTGVAGRGSGQYLTVHGGLIDEGPITTITNSKSVTFLGTILMGGANCLSVDATSEVREVGGYCGTFNGGPGGGGPTVASGGQLSMTDVEVSANGAGQYCYNAVAAGGIFDLGYNKCILAGGATTYKVGSFGLQFPLTTDSTTQLGGRQTVSGTAPTCSVTGAGSTATCTIDTGSTDAAGKMTVTPGGAGIAALGTLTLTFSTTPNGAYGTNGTNCSSNYMNGTGAWNVRAGALIYTTLGTTTAVANWDNNAVVLTGASTYKVTYTCYGQ